MLYVPRAVWDALRIVLIAVGSMMVGYGWLDAADVEPLADKIIELLGGALVVVGAGWWLFVTLRTKAVLVPATVVEELKLPVVSPVTGVVKRKGVKSA